MKLKDKGKQHKGNMHLLYWQSSQTNQNTKQSVFCQKWQKLIVLFLKVVLIKLIYRHKNDND